MFPPPEAVLIEANSYAEQAAETRELVQSFEVKNDQDSAFAAGLLGEIKKQIKAVEARRKTITEPLNVALKQVNDLFRPAREALEAGERSLKGAIASYLTEKEGARRKLLEEASQAKTVVEAETALAKIDAPTFAPTGVTIRKVRKFEVVNADAVPREFCSPDPDKIKLAISAGVDVPGVRVFDDAVVAARSS